MKISEMNARQKKAFMNIKNAANWYLGGLENTLEDYEIGSEEYESAKATLADHEGLVTTLYDMATTDIYTEGGCMFGDSASRFLKDIRFCGKAWLMERCEKRITKCGY